MMHAQLATIDLLFSAQLLKLICAYMAFLVEQLPHPTYIIHMPWQMHGGLSYTGHDWTTVHVLVENCKCGCRSQKRTESNLHQEQSLLEGCQKAASLTLYALWLHSKLPCSPLMS